MPKDTPAKRAARVKRAKKKIVSLVDKGVRINPAKQSDFTSDAVERARRNGSGANNITILLWIRSTSALSGTEEAWTR